MKMYYIISSTHKFQSVERLNTVTDNSKKAKKICNENFLGNLFVSNTSSQFSAIKAQCKPSMKTFAVNKDAYYFIKLVLLKETAFVHSAVYLQSWIVWGVQSCWRASFYPCEKKSSCTSQVCQWQRPRKITNPSSPKKLEDLQFIKTDGVDKEIPQKPYPGVYQASSCNDPDKFLAEVLDGLKQLAFLVYFIKLCLML